MGLRKPQCIHPGNRTEPSCRSSLSLSPVSLTQLTADPADQINRHSRSVKRNNQTNLNQASRAAKQSLRLDLLEFLRENAPKPEVVDENGEYQYGDDDYDYYDYYEDDSEPEVVVPSPDEDVFDKVDVAGQAILADAVNKAIEKFESKET